MSRAREMVKEMELLRAREYLPDEFVSFHRDLIRSQGECKSRLVGADLLTPLSTDEADRRLKEGVHLLDLDSVQIDEEPLNLLFLSVCESIERYGQWEAAETDRLTGAVKDGRLDLTVFVRKAAAGDAEYFDSLSAMVGIGAEHLLYLGIELGRPFFELSAEKVRDRIDDTVWQRGVCPVCGHEPAMGRLEKEEGRRFLHCSLCGTEWAFRRIQCPFCLNDDHNTLRFFFVEEGSPYRVDVCDVCRTYLKTVDERRVDEGKEILVPVEKVATTVLDLLAHDEGYNSPGPSVFGVSDERLPGPG